MPITKKRTARKIVKVVHVVHKVRLIKKVAKPRPKSATRIVVVRTFGFGLL
jgi:hypothetical protein